MSDTDLELLARFARDRADEAFAELVRRHLGLVHSAALRQVRSPQLAEEVAQSTFLKLAQHARQLAPGTVLSAWLYQVTRREARRQLREQIATEMNAMNATTADLSRRNPMEADWTHIKLLLDAAMHVLDVLWCQSAIANRRADVHNGQKLVFVSLAAANACLEG